MTTYRTDHRASDLRKAEKAQMPTEPEYAIGALTAADLDHMETDERWLGWGYLGERARAFENGRDIEEADTRALAAANAEGLDYEALFEWANSKYGRWYGDCMFGAGGQHAEMYLPGEAGAKARRAHTARRGR